MQNQSVCMFTLIFCVGTWLFQPVNYYCLCSFDSKQFPEIKKCCSQTFWMLDCGWLSHSSMLWCKGRRRHSEEMEKDTIYAEDYSLNPSFSYILLSLQWFPFIPKSGIISIQMKSRAEQLNTAFTYRWLCKFIHCSLMQQEKKGHVEKTVIIGSRVITTAEERLWVSLESGLCESAQPNEILHNHMAGLWATQWQQHLLSQLVFTPSIFRANGPSQSWSLTCNSPLM